MRIHFFPDNPVLSPPGGGSAGGPPSTEEPNPEQLQQEYDAYIDKVAQKVSASLGMKDGQDIPTMISGATRKSVGLALGLEKGQDAKEFFTGIVQDAMKTKAESASSTTLEGDPNSDLRTEFEGIKTTMQQMQTERDQAKQEVAEERRLSAIRDALGSFDLRPEIKPLITKVFLQGLEGPRMELNGDGNLIIESDNGHSQEASAFLKGYFEDNRWALTQFAAKGSGAQKRGSAASSSSQDFSKIGTQEGLDEFAKAAEADQEKAIEGLRDSSTDRRKRIYGTS